MKKIIGLMVFSIFFCASSLHAAKLRQFVDVHFDAKAVFGVSGGTNAIKEIYNANTTSFITLTSTNTNVDYTLYWPEDKPASDGQALLFDSNGQGFFGTATLTDEQVQDKVGDMFTDNEEFEVRGVYDDITGKIDLTVSSNVVLVSSISSIANLEAAIGGTNIAIEGENITFGNVGFTLVHSSGNVTLNRDGRLVFDEDSGSDTYIVNDSGTDNLDFYRNGILYMRFED